MTKAKSRGGANVFADLGFHDAETHLLKAQLVARLRDVISSKSLTQVQAADVIGVSQPDVSRLLRGHFDQISVERLMMFLARLGCAVDIVVKPANKRAFPPIHVETESA